MKLNQGELAKYYRLCYWNSLPNDYSLKWYETYFKDYVHLRFIMGGWAIPIIVITTPEEL